MPISITQSTINPLQKYGNAEQIVHLNFASNDWHCPVAKNDFRPRGKIQQKKTLQYNHN